MSEAELKARRGDLIVFSTGEYSDYGCTGHFVALEDITGEHFQDAREDAERRYKIADKAQEQARSFLGCAYPGWFACLCRRHRASYRFVWGYRIMSGPSDLIATLEGLTEVDALIADLEADVRAHEVTGNGKMRRVESIRRAIALLKAKEAADGR